MANSTRPQPSSKMTYQGFLDSLETAKRLYARLVERTPYLSFIEAAYARRFSLSKASAKLEHKEFKDFLNKAGTITATTWRDNKEFILPAAVRVEAFSDVARSILQDIQELVGDTIDYEEIKKNILDRESLYQSAVEWYDQLYGSFAYFREYKGYLDDAIAAAEIANIATEAKKSLKETKEITDSQKQMLEESGGLARANVYYELAYGAAAGSEKGSKRRIGHRESAMVWLYGVVASVLLTALTAIALFAVMDIDFSRTEFEVITLILVKALILLPFFYLIRFCVHSYRVNKHLEVLYAHRWALHETLAQYLKTGDSNGKESSLRMGQLNQITPFFYNEIETGFISKKDGLGDKSIEVIPEDLMKGLKVKIK